MSISNISNPRYKHCFSCGLIFQRSKIVNGKCPTCPTTRKTRRCACGKFIPTETLCSVCYWERDCEHNLKRINCCNCNLKKQSVTRVNGWILKKFE